MAEPRNPDDRIDTPDPDETRDMEQERVRHSNDLDQELERSGEPSRHNRGYDEAVRGEAPDQESSDVDPDSADSGVDRDDME